MRRPLAAVAASALLVAGATAVPSAAHAAEAGLTDAPDLIAVENFREGPLDADGGRQTLVDFVFDQAAYLNGGDHSNFHLVPLDGGDALDARGLQPEADQDGDDVVTVLFRGEVVADDYARGFVDTGIVSSRDGGAGPDDPYNVNQSAAVSNGGRTDNPDLVSVTRDGDTVLFEFDQDLDEEDVVENNGGLRIYFASTGNDRIPDAGALAVDEVDRRTLRAFYGDDLPEDFTLEDAVGGFVTQGSVQAAEGERGANDGVNAFDEAAPMGDTGAVVCAPYDGLAVDQLGTGPTDAPDLLRVESFRRGPYTAQFEPTTCVDFVFDQDAWLNGGNRSSFALVPADGGDALDGTTNVLPPDDEEGDEVVTVVFPGEVSPEQFPRAYVDSGVVGSEEGNADADDPLNVNQAAATDGEGRTANPDLSSVTRDGDTVLFAFDEALDEQDVVEDTAGLRIYFPSTSNERIPEAAAQAVEEVDERTLRALFGDLPEGFALDDAVGGFVTQGAVQGAVGSRGANDGDNAFDESRPLQDSGTVVCPAYDALGQDFVGAGATEAPDLVRVGNFRRGPYTDQFTPTTCVDFSFDQAAYLNGGERSNFHLVPLSGGDALDGSTNVLPPEDEEGDEIVTVAFPGELSPEDFARGFVDTGVVNSAPTDATAANPLNVNQSEDITPATSTDNPDVVRVSRERDAFVFEFDQPLVSDDVVQNNSGLSVYFPRTSQSATIPSAGALRVEEVDDRTLRAFYSRDLPEGYTLDDVVGAFVEQGSVQAADGGANDGANAFHEVVVFGTSFPDLTPVCNGLLATVTGSGTISGTSGADVIVGSAGPDEITAGDGDDVVCGRGGDDLLKGQEGADALFGDDGSDDVRGQSGDDALYGGYGGDLLRGERGDDVLFGGPGDDDLRGERAADLFDGGPGTDESDYDSAEDVDQVRVP